MAAGSEGRMHTQFDVKRFIGRGCYSLVYEALHKQGPDANTPYALKRFFLQNSSAVNCALRERRILERLALEDIQSPFLPTLFYSFTVSNQPVFLLREGTGCDLFDLLHAHGLLPEQSARFYAAELISGLEQLHSIGIVHLDLKPENVLLSHSGHIFIADFDRSYDLSRSATSPNDDDFTGTPLFMAPEIARGEVITTKADIWSLAVLMAEMVSGPIRPAAKDLAEDLRWAKEGRLNIRALRTFTKPLQAFFCACFQRKHNQRPDLEVVRKLRFFKCINWAEVKSCSRAPPIEPSSIVHRPTPEAICKLDPMDPLLLAAAFGKEMPVTKKRLCGVLEQQGDGSPHLATESADTEELSAAGITSDVLLNLLSDFNFVHPSLRVTENAEPPLEPPITLDKHFISNHGQGDVEYTKLELVRNRNRKCSAGD